ncbi:S1C family serine protease [Actinoallomurus rhizosphaericola]|uniref:S1C family serine protease n=1 Tax=Actinoallomurus rhizosphaericola TaxID=2952536 RepID=UPI002091550D|nr:trypsin-like peptidase domain-containing protein [Actinoallomurus rhizosphaericola]MCO5992734.1 trypsin-like peptidase domain-containing protein [Actinoallomurus rhizosphaericola]
METHDRSADERPEESQAGTTPSVEARTGSSSTSEAQPEDVRSWPPSEQWPGAEQSAPAAAGETPSEPQTQGAQSPQTQSPQTQSPQTQGPQAQDTQTQGGGGQEPPYGARPEAAAYGAHGEQPHGMGAAAYGTPGRPPYQAPGTPGQQPPQGPGAYGQPYGAHPDPYAYPAQTQQSPVGRLTARRKAAASGIALALVLAGGLAGGAVAALVDHGRTVYASPTAVHGASNKSATGIAAIAQAVQPSVVSITVTTPTEQGEGSGIILRSDGVILTNNHVVADASQGSQISVNFSDGKKASATVLGTDPATDLAVIKAAGVSGLKPATLGNSDQLQVGDPVVAIGSPLGLEGSVTSGIVSALHRTLNEGGDQQQQQPGFPGWGQQGQQGQQQSSSGATIGDAIQTDAAINPGNSGGPLVNSSGQVIGINTAIATSGGSNGNIGVGFAIPIDTAKQVADQLIKSGKATHAYLGVSLSDVAGDQQGALIAGVQKGTPAASAGLQEGDIVTQIDGKAIQDAQSLSAAIRGHQPGDKISLTFVRGGSKHTVSVTLTANAGN